MCRNPGKGSLLHRKVRKKYGKDEAHIGVAAGVCNADASALWRSMLAGCFDLPVRTAVSKEGPALGAAILAAVCAGLYPSVPEACDVMVAYNEAMEPADQAAYAKAYERYVALYPALKQQYADLAAL